MAAPSKPTSAIQIDFYDLIGLFRPKSTKSGQPLATGFMRTIDLETMIERLRAGGPDPITWLIGAGFSASAGIPLASGVCKRLLTFHYLQRQAMPPPYPGQKIKTWTEFYIRPFLAWADKDDSKFEELADSAR